MFWLYFKKYGVRFLKAAKTARLYPSILSQQFYNSYSACCGYPQLSLMDNASKYLISAVSPHLT